MVAKAKKLIREGDVSYRVLSQRFSADDFETLDYYCNLCVTNPSNYLYFYDFEYQVIALAQRAWFQWKWSGW